MRRFLHPILSCALALACGPLVAACANEEEESVSSSEAPLSEGDEAMVDTDALNLRAGPSTDHEILAVMPGGARVRVRGAAEGTFTPVTFGEIQGWAATRYLRAAAPAPPIAVGSIADAVAQIAAEAPRRSPGTDLAIAVMNLTTGEYAGSNDHERHVSASSAKVLWVAAAMHAGADVSDIAPGIFRDSNNELSGTAIDRAGGPDAVNAFLWDVVGMERSILANWSFGGVPRHATNQGLLGGDNYFTARDLMTFMSKLDQGALLGARTEPLRGYMKLAPDGGVGGWLPAMLPAGVRPEVMHKGGWLPPPAYPEYATMNDAGIVQVPGGDRYAVAILARHGNDYWGAQARFVERASCVVYRTVARDAALGCND
jgi:beta-lactamase class A